MTAPAARLSRVERGSSAEMVARLLDVLLPDAETVLDMTWGNGAFWEGTERVSVYGMDRDPERARDACLDFTRPLPFRAGAFDVAIFDPPYITNAGSASIMGKRFGSFKSIPEMRTAIEIGASEAWRVSRVGIVVKVMDQIRGARLVRMSQWVEAAIPSPLYDWVLLESPAKVEDGRWTKNGPQLSVRSTATSWLVFRHDGAVHKRRPVAGLWTDREARGA